MGFLSKIFKRKKGGTFLGNMLRGASSKLTGGILGSGAGLEAWEEGQADKEILDLKKQLMISKSNRLDGRALGGDIVNSTIKQGVAQPQNSPNAGEHIILTTLKKWWWAVSLGLIALIVGVVLLTRKSSGSARGRKNAFKRLN